MTDFIRFMTFSVFTDRVIRRRHCMYVSSRTFQVTTSAPDALASFTLDHRHSEIILYDLWRPAENQLQSCRTHTHSLNFIECVFISLMLLTDGNIASNYSCYYKEAVRSFLRLYDVVLPFK